MDSRNNPNIEQTELSAASPNKRRWTSMGYILIAFMCAMGLWFYVADYDTIVERTITSVPVDLLLPDAETGLTVESGMEKFVEVIVTGKKAVVNEVTAADLYAYIDASGIKNEMDVALDIQVDSLKDGVSVVKKSDTPTITVRVVSNTTKPFKVTAKEVGGAYDPAYTIKMQCLTPQIDIEGSASVINRIASAEVRIDVGDIYEPKLAWGTVVLLDSDGNTIPQTYLKLSEENIQVYVNVLVEKELKVNVEFSGNVYDVETAGAEIICTPATVTVYGGITKLADMDELTLYVDETQIDGDTFILDMELPDLSDDEIEYRSEGKNVLVTIKQSQIISKTLPVKIENISVKNLPEHLLPQISALGVNGEEQSTSVSIVVTGYRETVEMLSTSLLDIYIDFSDYIPSPGEEFVMDAYINYPNMQGVFTTDKITVYGVMELNEEFFENSSGDVSEGNNY